MINMVDKVVKIDMDNNEIKLEGVKFEVLDENETVFSAVVITVDEVTNKVRKITPIQKNINL